MFKTFYQQKYWLTTWGIFDDSDLSSLLILSHPRVWGFLEFFSPFFLKSWWLIKWSYECFRHSLLFLFWKIYIQAVQYSLIMMCFATRELTWRASFEHLYRPFTNLSKNRTIRVPFKCATATCSEQVEPEFNPSHYSHSHCANVYWTLKRTWSEKEKTRTAPQDIQNIFFSLIGDL